MDESGAGDVAAEDYFIFCLLTCFLIELLLCRISDIGGSGLTAACCYYWSAVVLLPLLPVAILFM